MPDLELKPTHKVVTAYYDNLARFEKLGVKHEGAVRSCFQELLDHCGRQFDWKLVPEYRVKAKGGNQISIDGALLDKYGLPQGHWEAKDSADDLNEEIKNKFKAGYPKLNILFWQPDRAVLYQNSERHFEADLKKPDDLVHILKLFLEFAPPAIAEWEKAVEEFKDRIPQIGASLKKLIETERQTNKKFIAAFDDFCSLCRGSLNPNISIEAVEEMIIQHILTERIFRKIFDVADFISRNVIAQEIEKVITALNSRSFSRDDFSKSLEHFYGAIENAAATITDFHEKQTFLNTVYERFFQGFCVKVADTHGIVYTPQPLVNFMVASVEHVLKEEFGKTLADRDVHILDPFTGTGNFIVNIMRHIPKTALPHKFAQELHCNEIMLLPYYVASMNIEHAYWEATGQYQSFEGVCLVDTFQTAETAQTELSFFNEKNSARVERQKKDPIRVIIVNPPYNSGQQDENDNNRNRTYPELERRVKATYSDDSKATLKNSMGDPYIKAFRWASDRLGDNGIVCFVTNNGFLEGVAGDGIRRHLAQDFDEVYHFDLKGNARTTGERRREEGGNVFSDQIRVGVGITLLVRRQAKRNSSIIKLHRVADYLKADAKQGLLEKYGSVSAVRWKKVVPDKRYNWLTEGLQNDFDEFLPVGSKDAKASDQSAAVFRTYSNGVKSNNDEFVYDFDPKKLKKKAELMVEAYETQFARWEKAGRPEDVEKLIKVDPKVLKWIRRTKKSLARGLEVKFEAAKNGVPDCGGGGRIAAVVRYAGSAVAPNPRPRRAPFPLHPPPTPQPHCVNFMPALAADLSPPINHVFVDFENVHQIDLAVIGSKAVSFTLLVGPKQAKLDVTLVEKLFEHAVSVQLARLTSIGRNALDFAVAYYLGRAVATDPTGCFHIVSKDSGFDPLIEHLRSRHISVLRHDTFATLPFAGPARLSAPIARTIVPKVKSQARRKTPTLVPDERTIRMLEHLRKPSATHPKNKKKLISYLVAYFGHKITEGEALNLVEKLHQAGHLAIGEKGTVTYRLEPK
jgi:hypothetical protein